MDLREKALKQLKLLKDSFLYTPSKEDVQSAIEDFFSSDAGKGWIEAAIRLDPALQRQDIPARINGDGKPHVEPIEGAIDQLLTYQGLHAVALHHKAHGIYEEAYRNFQSGNYTGAARRYFEARKISQGTRRITAGIEIHPGATIGKDFFIDHGAGIVVGETCEIGDDVFLYHGVTLGAFPGKTTHDGIRGDRRHPKLGNNVMIGSEAQILGPALIGNDVRIGAGAKLVGNIVVEEGATIGAGVEIVGDVVIEKKARIEAGSKIVSPKRPISEEVGVKTKTRFVEEKISIGADATIQPGLTIHENVKPEVTVSDVMPYIPGSTRRAEARARPFTVIRISRRIAFVNANWEGIARKLQQMLQSMG
ncbi:MAG: hypothetical protein U1E36_02285 [Rickettsiales bacterium]